MSQGFRLAGELHIQNVVGIRQAFQQVQNEFRNAGVEVNVKVSPASLRTIDELNARVNALRGNIDSVQTSTSSVSRGIADINTSARASASGISSLNSSLNAARTSLAQARQQAIEGASSFERFGQQAGYLARRFTAFSVATGSIIALVQGIKSGIGQALEFERAMTRLVQVSGDTPDRVASVTKSISQLSSTLGVSSKDLAEAAVTFRQAGIATRDLDAALQAVAKAALAPNFGSMNEVVEGSIAIVRQFDKDVNNLEGRLGAINAVAGEFAVEASDLNEVLRRTGGAFKSAGGEMNELLGLFTAVRSTTRESAETIATGLRTVFSRIQRNDTVEALRSLQIQLRYTREEATAMGRGDLQGQFVGAYEAIKRISEGLSSIRSSDPRFASIIEELGGTRQISKIIPLIREFGEAQKAVNVAQAGQISIQINAERAQNSLLQRTAAIKEQYLDLFRTLTQDSGFKALANNLLSIASGFGKVLEYAKPLLPILTTIAAVKLFQNAGNFGAGFGSGVVDRLYGNPARQLTQRTRIPGMARGGVVPGSGNQDSELTYLMPGEFVVRKHSAQQIGYDNLAAMNEGRVQRRAGGGFIDKIIDAILPSKVASPVKSVTRAGLKALFAPYLPFQALAKRVALSKDTSPEDAEKLQSRLALADGAIYKGAAIGGPLGLVPAAIASGMFVIPPATTGYLAANAPRTARVLGGMAYQNRKPLASLLTSLSLLVNGGMGADVNGLPVQQTASTSMVRRFSRGGKQTDTVPALLTPGEFVFNRDAVARIGAARLNSMNVHGYATGGLVGTHGPVRLASGGKLEPVRSAINTDASLYEVQLRDLKRLLPDSAKDIGKALKNIGLLGTALGDLRSVFVRLSEDGKASLVGPAGFKVKGTGDFSRSSAGKYDRFFTPQELSFLNQPNVKEQVRRLNSEAVESKYYQNISSLQGGDRMAETLLHRAMVQAVSQYDPSTVQSGDPTEQAKNFVSFSRKAFFKDQLGSVSSRATKKVESGTAKRVQGAGVRGDEEGPGVIELATGTTPSRRSFVRPDQEAAEREEERNFYRDEIAARAAGESSWGAVRMADRLKAAGRATNRGSSLLERMRAKQAGAGVAAQTSTDAGAAANSPNYPLVPAFYPMAVVPKLYRPEPEATAEPQRLLTDKSGQKLLTYQPEQNYPLARVPGTAMVPSNRVSVEVLGYSINKPQGQFKVDVPQPQLTDRSGSPQRLLTNADPYASLREVFGRKDKNDGLRALFSGVSGPASSGSGAMDGLFNLSGDPSRTLSLRGFATDVQRQASAISSRRISSRGGAELLSEQTQVEVANRSVNQTFAQKQREFLSAQDAAIRVLQPNVTAMERTKMAWEALDKALRGAAVAYSPDGKALGLASTVKDLEAQGKSAPGASRFTRGYNAIARGFNALGELPYAGRAASFVGRNYSRYADFYNRSSGLGYAGAMGLSYLGNYIGELGGSAEQVASSNGSGRGFSAARAVGGGLSSAVLGATIGGAIGGPFAPLTAAIGGAAGAVFGFVSSLSEAEKEIRNAKIAAAINEFSDKIKILAAVGNSASSDVVVGARTNLERYTNEAGDRARVDNTGWWSGFNLNGFLSSRSKNLRNDLGNTLPDAVQSLNRQAEDIAKANVGRPVNDLVQILERGRNGLNQSLIRMIADIRGVSIATVLEEFKKVIEQTTRTARFERQSLAGRVGEEGNLNAFGRLVTALQSASDSLSHLTDRTSLLNEAFTQTAGSFRVNLGAERFNQLGRNDREVFQTIGTLRAATGADGQRLSEAAVIAARLEDVLPSILTQTLPRASQSEEEYSSLVRNRLTDALGSSPQALNAINSVISQIGQKTRSGGLDGITRDTQVDVTKLAQSLTEAFTGPIRESGRDVTRLLEDRMNGFTSALAELAERTRAVGEAMQRVSDLRSQGTRLRAEANDFNAFLPLGTTLRSTPVSLLNTNLQARQERLTGLSGDAANDPQAILTLRGQLESERQRALERRNAIIREQPRNTAGIADATVRFETLRTRVRDLDSAMLHLTEVTTRNAAAQERLSQIRNEEDARFGYARRYVTADAEGKNQMNLDLAALTRTAARGNLNGLPQYEIDSTFRALSDLRGSGPLSFLGNRSAETVERSLLLNSTNNSQFLRGSPAVQQERQQLIEEILRNQSRGEQAAGGIENVLKNTIEKLKTDTLTIQNSFFTRLDQMLTRNALATAQVNNAQAKADATRLEEQGVQAQYLNGAGIRNTRRLREAQALQGDFQNIFSFRRVAQGNQAALAELSNPALTGRIGSVFGDANILNRGRLSDVGANGLRTLLSEGGFRSLTSPQIDSVIQRFNREVEGDSALRGSLQGPGRNQAVSSLLRRVVGQELGGSRNVDGTESVFGAVLRNRNESVQRLRDNGFNPDALNNVPGDGSAFLRALTSFSESAVKLEDLPAAIQTANTRLRETAEDINRIRQSLTTEPQPPSPQSPAPIVVASANGGMTPDPRVFKPRGTDTVPAMLTPGEFVVNTRSAQANAGLLHRINNSRGPLHLAEGGSVNGTALGLGTLIGIPSALLGGFLLNDLRTTLGGRPTQANIQSIMAAFQAEHGIDFRQLAPGGIFHRETNNGGLFFNRSRRIALSTAGSRGHLSSTLAHELGHGALVPSVQRELGPSAVRRFANQALRYGGVDYQSLGYGADDVLEEAFANLFGEAVSGFRPQAVENAGNPGRRYDVLVRRFRERFLPRLRETLAGTTQSAASPASSGALVPAPAPVAQASENAGASVLESMFGRPTGPVGISPGTPLDIVPPTSTSTLSAEQVEAILAGNVQAPATASAAQGPGRLTRFWEGTRGLFGRLRSGISSVPAEQGLFRRLLGQGYRLGSSGLRFGGNFLNLGDRLIGGLVEGGYNLASSGLNYGANAIRNVASGTYSNARGYLGSLFSGTGAESSLTLPTSALQVPTPNVAAAQQGEGFLARVLGQGRSLLSQVRNSYSGIGTLRGGVSTGFNILKGGFTNPTALATLVPNIVGGGLDYLTAASDTYDQTTNTPISDALVNQSGSVTAGLLGELLVNLGERPIAGVVNTVQRGLYGESGQERNIRQRRLERQQESADRESMMVTTRQRLERLNAAIASGIPGFITGKRTLLEGLGQSPPPDDYFQWSNELQSLATTRWFAPLSNAETRNGGGRPSLAEGLERIRREVDGFTNFGSVQRAANILDQMYGDKHRYSEVKDAVSWVQSLSGNALSDPLLSSAKSQLADTRSFIFNEQAERTLQTLVEKKKQQDSSTAEDRMLEFGYDRLLSAPKYMTEIDRRRFTEVGVQRLAEIGLKVERQSALRRDLQDAPEWVTDLVNKVRDEQIGRISQAAGNGGQLPRGWRQILGQRRDSLSPELQALALANGGVVKQSMYLSKGGFGTDSVPAMLTPNEFVVNAASAQANRHLLERVNNAKGPVHLAGGGNVGNAGGFNWNVFNRQATTDPFGASGEIAAFNNGQNAFLRNARQARQRDNAQTDRDRILLNMQQELQQDADAKLQEAGRISPEALEAAIRQQRDLNRQIREARQREDARAVRNQQEAAQGGFDAITQRNAQRAGNNAFEAQSLLGSLNTLAQRQALARSQNPFAAFGIAQANSGVRAGMQSTALIEQQRERDKTHEQLRRANGAVAPLEGNEGGRGFLGALAGITRQVFGFASGGSVPGFGNGDTVPSLLTPGEFVFTRRAVQNLGGANAVDRIHRFANGGVVESDIDGGGSKGIRINVPQQQGAASAGDTQLAQAMLAFGNQATQLAQAFATFNTSSQALVTALRAFPTHIELTGRQTIEVVVNGAEAIAQLEPRLKESLSTQINDAIAGFFKRNLPEVSVTAD